MDPTPLVLLLLLLIENDDFPKTIIERQTLKEKMDLSGFAKKLFLKREREREMDAKSAPSTDFSPCVVEWLQQVTDEKLFAMRKQAWETVRGTELQLIQTTNAEKKETISFMTFTNFITTLPQEVQDVFRPGHHPGTFAEGHFSVISITRLSITCLRIPFLSEMIKGKYVLRDVTGTELRNAILKAS